MKSKIKIHENESLTKQEIADKIKWNRKQIRTYENAYKENLKKIKKLKNNDFDYKKLKINLETDEILSIEEIVKEREWDRKQREAFLKIEYLLK